MLAVSYRMHTPCEISALHKKDQRGNIIRYFYILYKMSRFFHQNRRWYYTLFAIAFGAVWYLFKLGGIPKPALALLSTGIDLFSACRH
jgi:hypothetical protein